MLLGLGGDALSAPQDTLVAYWAALAAGANGVAVNVREGSGQQLVCAPAAADGRDLERLDAGEPFVPRGIDDEGSAILAEGPSPWLPAADRLQLFHPALDEVLRALGRRATSMLRLAEDATVETLQRAVQALQQFGLLTRVPLEVPLALLRQSRPQWRPLQPGRSWIARIDGTREQVQEARELDVGGVAFSWQGERGWDSIRAAAAAQLSVWLLPAAGRLALPAPLLRQLAAEAPAPEKPAVHVITGAVVPALDILTPRACVFKDSLTQSSLDPRHWAAGYSRSNTETQLAMDAEGFRIRIAQGREYSGGGLVSRLSVSGDFDASVDFSVANPTQGTTFEMAAIAIDPPRASWRAGSSASLDPNLVFDVHGAPPYASSERDENDGYRIGWNNSSNLTRILEPWNHASGNMFNQYGRDVGSGKAGAGLTTGRLRLARHGSVFASYYADATTGGHWVCSGTASVSTMPAEVHVRLAAKHWEKKGVQAPPENEVIFREFVLRQP